MYQRVSGQYPCAIILGNKTKTQQTKSIMV